MKSSFQQTKIEYGDFQTPLELANYVCQKLKMLGVSPSTIIEPTCGIGAFVGASAHYFPNAKKIIGIEVNETYLNQLQNRKSTFPNNERITLQQGNFFDFKWKE